MATDKNQIWLRLFSYLTFRKILHCHVPLKSITLNIKKSGLAPTPGHYISCAAGGSEISSRLTGCDDTEGKEVAAASPLCFPPHSPLIPPASLVPVGPLLSLKVASDHHLGLIWRKTAFYKATRPTVCLQRESERVKKNHHSPEKVIAGRERKKGKKNPGISHSQAAFFFLFTERKRPGIL